MYARDFREKIVGLIEHNPNPYGIPQGSPISDLLANLYMIDFDNEMNQFLASKGGAYYRYSDDILIILPAPLDDWQTILSYTQTILSKNTARLTLKDKKKQVYYFHSSVGSKDQEGTRLYAQRGTNGLEYLGFRYDGKKVYLRNSTISGAQRKMTSVAKRLAREYVDKNPSMSLNQLLQTFNYEILLIRPK